MKLPLAPSHGFPLAPLRLEMIFLGARGASGTPRGLNRAGIKFRETQRHASNAKSNNKKPLEKLSDPALAVSYVPLRFSIYSSRIRPCTAKQQWLDKGP